VAGQTVLIHGAAGNVGVYAVQLAAQAGLHVFGTASASEAKYVESLGAARVIDYKAGAFERLVPAVDIVLDTVGGETRKRSIGLIKSGGILVSVVSEPMPSREDLGDVQAAFFLVEVTTERLDRLTERFERGELVPRVGTIVPLEQARTAHEMLAGAPHKPGKIVLSMA
jgi:NADPH:quinone reductase-like Zn-dependent oxidoreductase